MELTSSGSSKKARGVGSTTHVASCLVDGCISDLSKCRDYHRRHKVCELHSKSSKVTIVGREQRFCQQCSRFHSLVEFDQGKRSCRKRLDGHNRRRRKPQPETLPLNSERFLASHHGAVLPFSSPEIFATSSPMSSPWNGVVKSESGVTIFRNHSQMNFGESKSSFHGTSSLSPQVEKQFILQDPNCNSAGVLNYFSQPLLNPNHTSVKVSTSQNMFPDRLNRVLDSDSALSLLSSPPAETRETGFSHMLEPEPMSLAQSSFPTLQYNGLGTGVGSVLIPDGRDGDNFQPKGLFHQIVQDESTTSRSHQTHSFNWE